MKPVDILAAITDVDDEYIEAADISGKKRHRQWHKAAAFAACFLIVICTVIISFSYLRPIQPEVSHEESISSDESTKYTLIKTLETKKVYGEFALSKQPENELSKIFPKTYNKTLGVYEDDRYFYSFDDKGRLLEMISASAEPKAVNRIGETEVRYRISSIFSLYLPDLELSQYEIDIEYSEYEGGRWSITAAKTENDMIVSTVTVDLFADGEIDAIWAERTYDTGSITSKQALDKAVERLKEINNDTVPEGAKIKMSTISYDGVPCYEFSIRYNTVKADGNSVPNTLQIKINADTGEVFESMMFRFDD